jgi:hypothetical protein
MYLPDTNETFFDNVLSIPEKHVNDYKIRHKASKAGKEFNTASPRTAIFGNHEAGTIQLTSDAIFHELSYDGGVWMTDYPIEQAQHDALLKDAHGRVLVGGLGLGYAVRLLSHNPNVNEIVVVEKSHEVIDMVWPYTINNRVRASSVPLNRKMLRDKKNTVKVQIIQADLMDFVKNPKSFTAKSSGFASEWDDVWFDVAFHDIWQHDGEGTFHEFVVPLLRHASEFAERVINWNEDVMRGQLFMGLLSRANFALMSDPDRAESDTAKAFALKLKETSIASWRNTTGRCHSFGAFRGTGFAALIVIRLSQIRREGRAFLIYRMRSTRRRRSMRHGMAIHAEPKTWTNY